MKPTQELPGSKSVKKYLGLKIKSYKPNEKINEKIVNYPLNLTKFWYNFDIRENPKIKYILAESKNEEQKKFNVFAHWYEHDPFYFQFPQFVLDFVKKKFN